MGAYNVLATCDDRLSVLSEVGRPKTGAAMAMQIPVAIVLVQGGCVVIGVVLRLGRCYVLISSFPLGQVRNPKHNVDRQRITPLAMRRHRRPSIVVAR